MKWFNDSKITLLLLAFVVGLVLSAGSTKADFTFGDPVKLVSPYITGYDDICCLSYDGLEMYFDSYRAGGQGDYDLWVLKRGSVDEDWGPPENLGPAVNSPQGDYYASISADGRVFQFSGSVVEESQSQVGLGSVTAKSRSLVTDPRGVQKRDDCISHSGQDLRGSTTVNPAKVFSERHIADVE